MFPTLAPSLSAQLSRALRLALATWILIAPGLARALTETRVESSTTTLELEPGGAATVRHDLALSVRGGKLASFTLRGVEADAEPLPGATLTRLSDGRAAAPPEPIQVQARDGTLEAAVPSARALRGTRFLLSVSYRTRLDKALVQALPDGEGAELAWVGPRFEDGVDAVTLIVRTPAAPTPPELVGEDEAGAQYGIVSSTLRRAREFDELELVRAHVARDEAIRWRVRLDRSWLADGTAAPAAAARTGAPRSPGAAAAAPAPRAAHRELAWTLALGAGYALLLWLKMRALARSAGARRATPRAWIPCTPVWRALLAGAAVSAACAVVASELPPWLAAAALSLAMALAAHHPSVPSANLLGLGEWQARGPEVLARCPSPALPGAWLDAGRARGFALLAAALAAIGMLAARAFASSPYLGACVLLSGAALLPIFCTGRAAELPPDGLDEARRLLGDVARRLGTSAPLTATPVARVAASGDLEELRLSLTLARPVPGLRGLELGVELGERLGGFSARPIVIVRSAEGSECQRALPRGLTWTRGRSDDERASVIRPKLPTATTAVALLHELAELWLAPSEPQPQPASGAAEAEPAVKKASKSAGKGLSTANAGTRSSPAHAT